MARLLPVHGTRHACGSLLATLDVHPRVAMQILRHSKIAVTIEIYTHIPPELTRSALHKLGDSLGSSEANCCTNCRTKQLHKTR